MGKDAAATYSAPTLRVEGLPIIRGRTFPTAFIPPASTKATPTEDIPITGTLLGTITVRRTTDGPITHGPLRSPMAGVGEERRGMATMARTTSRTRCILRRLSG